jgi:AraC-like DNA-binding protein
MRKTRRLSFLKKLKDPDFYENAPPAVLDAIVAISKNYKTKRLSTREIARIIGVSESHLCHAVRESFGFPCSELLQRFRIEMSKPLLMETKLLIKQVASAVGFNSPKYFCTFFKKVKGITPTKFRSRF